MIFHKSNPPQAWHILHTMYLIIQKAFILLSILVSANSFQNVPHLTRRNNAPGSLCVTDSIRRRPTGIHHLGRKTATTTLLSNNDSNAENTNNYNDDAFGFVLLIGYATTHDAIFAGTFVLLSAIAAIATRSGKLPATNSVPAAVAGFTYIVNFIIPSETLYQLLPFIERPEAALPVDISLIELGICSVSILYGLVLSSSNKE